MKSKILAIVMTLIMACSMLTATAFADGTYVPSPEHGNTDVDPNPQSPQTGYEFSIGGLALVAAVCGGVAVVTGKKAHERADSPMNACRLWGYFYSAPKTGLWGKRSRCA